MNLSKLNPRELSVMTEKYMHISRYFGLCLIVIFAIKVSITSLSKIDNNYFVHDDRCNCTISKGLCIPQSYSILQLYKNNVEYKIPVYMNHDVNQVNRNSEIKHVYIIQHGNLRNGLDYYCGSINAVKSSLNHSTTLILGMQFLIDNDTCWSNPYSAPIKIDIKNGYACNVPVFTSEGWKDGHLSKTHDIFSYEVFNMIIDYLGNDETFPSIRTITVFGFSAGAQVVLRYAMMPLFSVSNVDLHINYVISDPSSFLYLNTVRPNVYSNSGFSMPDSTWLYSWNDSLLTNNFSKWSNECENFNSWRYGFEKLSGYVEHYAKLDTNFIANIIKGIALYATVCIFTDILFIIVRFSI